MKKMPKPHQKLPPSGPRREALREKGQFWTPQWVAEAMVAYSVGNCATHVFDPAVGGGAFFVASKAFAARTHRRLELLGAEIDRGALEQCDPQALAKADLADVEIRDFVADPPDRLFHAIVANPPYIRHHRLGEKRKQQLRALSKAVIGKPIDGRAGYHVYFLLRALTRLEDGGRLAFIMPADTCEGVFARDVWNWITHHFRLDAVVRFAPDATPFPNVDTNALIFMICKAEPCADFVWCHCSETGVALTKWVESGLAEIQTSGIQAVKRKMTEALATGLSRPPQPKHDGPLLGDFIATLRGIATGANEFFWLTRQQAHMHNIPDQYLIPAIGRTRDVSGEELTTADVCALEGNGRPTLLLSLKGTTREQLPPALQAYIARGEELGLPERALIKQRKPWYKMEIRRVPPFLFAYLGRRNARFIRNNAEVVPLTGFLCVYRRETCPLSEDQLWELLRHPAVISNLHLVGKTYGSGAIKVEPRALEKLPIPEAALAEITAERPIRQAAFAFSPTL